jgi:glycine/D-amino acid oxidase-like deaminating enzyme
MPKSEPFWWDDAGAPASPPVQPLPAEVDVLVIGAGLTGLTAALTLAKWGKSVLALDAGAPGIGASSRNGGMIGGGHRLSIDEIEGRFGHDTAVNLLREAHLEATAFARNLIAGEGIDCDYVEYGRFRGLWTKAEYETSAQGLDRLQKLIPVEAEMIPRARQHEEVATDIYAGGVVFPRHGGLNPASYVAGVLDAAIRAGAQVQGDTPVTSLRREGATHLAETPRGVVRAGAVLAATNGYTPGALPAQKRRIVPLTSFLVTTEELGANRVRSLFPNGRMVAESRDRHCYYRPSPDGTRIVFGGRAAMLGVPNWFAEAELRRLLTQIFPQCSDVTFTHSWRGHTGFTFDFLPNVGQVDGVWHAMGYSGSGNAMAPYLGHKAALQIIGDPEGETAFSQTDFPTRWWHRGQPWFLPFADVLFRLKDVQSNLVRRM